MFNEQQSSYLMVGLGDWTSTRISVTYTSFNYLGIPSTILKITDAIKDKYRSWDCTDGNQPSPNNCTGFHISEVKYTGDVYNDHLFNQYSGGAITDVYQVSTWFLHPGNQKYTRFDLSNETLFEVNIPLKDTTMAVGDDIQVRQSQGR